MNRRNWIRGILAAIAGFCAAVASGRKAHRRLNEEAESIEWMHPQLREGLVLPDISGGNHHGTVYGMSCYRRRLTPDEVRQCLELSRGGWAIRK